MPGREQGSIQPQPTFSYSVDFGDGIPAGNFQDVAGLGDASSPDWGGKVTREGLFPASDAFWAWYNQIKTNTIQPGTIIITSLDAPGGLTTTWTLRKAWPTKLTSPDLKANSNEVSVASIEVVFETVSIASS